MFDHDKASRPAPDGAIGNQPANAPNAPAPNAPDARGPRAYPIDAPNPGAAVNPLADEDDGFEGDASARTGVIPDEHDAPAEPPVAGGPTEL